MRPPQLLTGVNSKCRQCSEECKQWEQVKIIICPSYKSIKRK